MNEPLDLIFEPGPDEDGNISLEQGKAPHDEAPPRRGGEILLFKGNSTFLGQFARGCTNRSGKLSHKKIPSLLHYPQEM